MATNAERQACRLIASARANDRQLKVWLDHRAASALARLARHKGVTKRVVIEQLVNAADRKAEKSLGIDSAEWAKYFSPAARCTA